MILKGSLHVTALFRTLLSKKPFYAEMFLCSSLGFFFF